MGWQLCDGSLAYRRQSDRTGLDRDPCDNLGHAGNKTNVLKICVVHSVGPYRVGLDSELRTRGVKVEAATRHVDELPRMERHANECRGLLYEHSADFDLDLVRERHQFDFEVAVIDLSAIQLVRDALRQRVSGLVDHRADGQEVVNAIELAANGRITLPTGTLRALAETSAHYDLDEKLTDEEVQHLQRLVDGQKVSQIAEQAGRSERDMYRVLARIWAKLGGRDRTEGLVLAARGGLLDKARNGSTR